MRKCRRCGQEKDESCYGTDRSQKDGVAVSCKDCNNRVTAEWRAANPEKVMCKDLRYCFGVDFTLDRFREMLHLQNGVCAGCGGQSKRRRLSVDHNHATGAVRGLLCKDCNLALGLIKDNPETLRRLVKYLEASESCEGNPR